MRWLDLAIPWVDLVEGQPDYVFFLKKSHVVDQILGHATKFNHGRQCLAATSQIQPLRDQTWLTTIESGDAAIDLATRSYGRHNQI